MKFFYYADLLRQALSDLTASDYLWLAGIAILVITALTCTRWMTGKVEQA